MRKPERKSRLLSTDEKNISDKRAEQATRKHKIKVIKFLDRFNHEDQQMLPQKAPLGRLKIVGKIKFIGKPRP